MKVSMFKKIFVFVMLSVAFGVDVPVKTQDFEKHELVQGNGDKHAVHAIEGTVLAGSEVPDEGIERELQRGRQRGRQRGKQRGRQEGRHQWRQQGREEGRQRGRGG